MGAATVGDVQSIPDRSAMMRQAYQLEPGSSQELETPSIAVLIPCYNEAATIADVVMEFQTALPDAAIYV